MLKAIISITSFIALVSPCFSQVNFESDTSYRKVIYRMVSYPETVGIHDTLTIWRVSDRDSIILSFPATGKGMGVSLNEGFEAKIENFGKPLMYAGGGIFEGPFILNISALKAGPYHIYYQSCNMGGTIYLILKE